MSCTREKKGYSIEELLPPNTKRESDCVKYPVTCPDLGLKYEDFEESVCQEFNSPFEAEGREHDSPAKPGLHWHF